MEHRKAPPPLPVAPPEPARLSVSLPCPTPSGKQHQCAEHCDVKAELGDRGVAEQVGKADAVQQRPQDQNDRERREREGHEWRKQHAADHELMKAVGHDIFPCMRAARADAWSMTVLATSRQVVTDATA